MQEAVDAEEAHSNAHRPASLLVPPLRLRIQDEGQPHQAHEVKGPSQEVCRDGCHSRAHHHR